MLVFERNSRRAPNKARANESQNTGFHPARKAASRLENSANWQPSSPLVPVSLLKSG